MSDNSEQPPAARSSWERRDLPILKQVVEAFNRGELVKDARRLAELTGLDQADALRGLEALHQAGYIDGIDASTMQDRFALLDIRPLERARRATGDWPAENAYDQLIELLERRIAETDDPDQRTKLIKLRDGVLAAGRDLITSVMAAVISGQITGGG